jgi:hypothetical protein
VTTRLVPVTGQSIRVYEEYHDPGQKRSALRRTKPKRGKATGLAVGYILVDTRCANYGGPGTFGGGGSIFETHDEGSPPRGIAHTTPHIDHLRWKCRRIARSELPEEWREALFKVHAIVERNGKLYDVEEVTP